MERPQERARSGLLGSFLTHPPSPGKFTHTDGPTYASLERSGPHSRPHRPYTAPPHVDTAPSLMARLIPGTARPGPHPHWPGSPRGPARTPAYAPARTARPPPERLPPHSRPRRPNTAPPHVDPGSYPHGTAHTRNGPRPGPPGCAPLNGPARTARPGPPGFAPPNGRPARPDLPRNGSPAPIAHGPSSLSRVTHY